MGPIVFDAGHLEHDDNDDYSDQDDEDQDPYHSRPKLGLDLSSLFLPIGNFLKLTAKSLETMFSLLEKQANLLLGRKIGREGSISVTIVIIISWLVMGLVVYAFAQFAILRRIRDEELEVEQAEQQEIENWRQQFLTAATATPALKTTPPTPSPKAGLNPSRSYFINSRIHIRERPLMTPDDFRKGVFALFLLSIWVQFVCITKQTNWTQMLNRKSANTPLLWLIFACALSLKRVFSEFLEAQLRSSKAFK